MRLFVLGSGSSGNCLVVEAEGERLVVDAGINPTRSTERMRALGADLITKRAPLGIFVTHDHGDHASHAVPMARALRTPLFLHPRFPQPRTRAWLEVCGYIPGRPLHLGPFIVEALGVPHDAPHVAFRISAGNKRFAVVTDVGHAPRELRALLAGCDTVLLEANYCPELLATGAYPPRLRERVGGPLGHLSNDQAAEVAVGLQDTRVERLVLAHLSRTNNSPERALHAVAARAHKLRVEAIPHGESMRLDVTGGASLRAAEQLPLMGAWLLPQT